MLLQGKPSKQKAIYNNKNLNCNKFGHFRQDYKQKKSKLEEFLKESISYQ